MKIKVFRYNTGLLPLSPSDTMVAAAHDGALSDGLVSKIQKNSLPRCASKEALRRESII